MNLRSLLHSGGLSYGPLILSDSPVITEILALAGYNHIVIDHEHSPTDVHSGCNLLRAIQAASSFPGVQPPTPIVRLPGHDTLYMKKILDTLPVPAGVLVPMVEDAATARAVVQASRYPPKGVRGCAAPFVRSSGFGTIDMETYQQRCDNETIVMVQVETPLGVQAIPEIAAVDGIDGIFLGPLDLSASIGKMGDFQSCDFRILLETAEDQIKAAPNCFLAGFKVPGRSVDDMFAKGYSFVCGSVDLGLLKDAVRRDVLAGKKAMASQGRSVK